MADLDQPLPPLSTPTFSIRAATAGDAPILFELITALADYEKLLDQVSGTVDALAVHLAASPPACEALLAEYEGMPVGFALYFSNYSTFLTKPGIYLEDLFVLPDYRRLGIGKALLARLAQIVLERDYGRLEWAVLDWNEPAIAFYQRMGATILQEWRICRVTGTAIASLAQHGITR